MRSVLTAITCIFLLFASPIPVSSDPTPVVQITPYVATFCSPEFEWMWVESHPPDMLVVANKGWSQLPGFCREARKAAHGRPLILDLDVHGSKEGLSVKIAGVHRLTTMGYVLNQIEQNAGTDNLTVFLESCYPGNAYFYTIRGNKVKALNHADRPIFLILGVGSGYSNWGNTVYLQWLFNKRDYFEDMRNYEIKKPNPEEKEDSCGISPTTRKLMKLFFKLYFAE